LELKLRLYGSDFSMAAVLPGDPIAPANTNTSIVDVGQAAITLLSPSPDELAEQFSSPPIASDQIAIFTDMRYGQQCGDCEPVPYIGETALADAILALYGPEASGQAQAEQISSYTFADLQAFLDAGDGAGILPEAIALEEVATDTVETPTAVPTPTPPAAFRVNATLGEADWIIFALLGDDEETAALHNFLADRPDIIRNSRVIVFTYNAPYFLDSTEVSKLTAYFGVYSKIDAFVDASVRALFLESPLSGKPPVSVTGINYDLAVQTAPNPAQVIELFIADINGDMLSPESNAPLQTAVGDTLLLQTGIILDKNGNPVPNGTMVRFMERDLVQGTENIIATIPTTNGYAMLDYLLQARTSAGTFSISAYAGATLGSQEVIIKIADANVEAEIIIITPTPLPTAVPTIAPTSTPAPTLQPTPTFPASPTPAPPPQEPSLLILLSQVQRLGMLFLGLAIVVGGITAVSYRKQWSIHQQVEGELLTALGALLTYIYLVLGWPGTAVFEPLGSWAALLATLVGGAVMAGIFVFRRRGDG
jgi:beta-N-acetylhexosaminidase